MIKEAALFERHSQNRVQCLLCAHGCVISPAKRGICGVRTNRNGKLFTLAYGNIIAENIDPIEKKPLFHVFPGSRSLSIAAAGCNFRCIFCQNNEISQMPREKGSLMGRETSSESIIAKALQSGSRTIAYTYTEPTVFFEFAFDTALKAREKGIGSVFVSNGYMSKECLELLPLFLDAANIDLKSMNDNFYRHYCGGRLQPVLDALKAVKKAGIWLEVTTLVIPGLNDSNEELKDIARFVAALGEETPSHNSRFHPQYKMRERPPTSYMTLRTAYDIGREAGL
ncbi:MAG: AmmeMemoRadiSam system radical SAM enzyme, partial [Syntrophales bacterium]|nr:AmmeMemoRadiSam system radical SAM enzyme [Syntrophales bacterium]